MLRRIHQKLGTAGFIISIVALVAALGGGAYAAKTGLTGKQKKEVQKIVRAESQKWSKKFAKPGPQGAAGQNGAAGPAGKDGAAGANGTNGAPGKGVVLGGASGAECAEGGITVEVEGSGGKHAVCNGEAGPEGPEGALGTAGTTLPSGATETGTWAFGPAAEGSIRVPFSFTVPLAGEVAVHFMEAGATKTAECPSEKVETGELEFTLEPKAAPGNLCIYQQGGFGGVFSNAQNPETGLVEGKAGKAGAIAIFNTQANSQLRGTWAVTAP